MDKHAVRKFYNDYVPRQRSVGINIRHLTILKKLKKAGLHRSASVLEVGCGIGTLTSLLAKVVTKGTIVATDISDESVAIAKADLKAFRNIEFVAADVSDLEDHRQYDLIVMADVIEHIPLEMHGPMFRKLSAMMHKDSVVAINIPFPPFNKWAMENTPEKMQIIDQAVHTNELLSAVYPAGLHLNHLETYSLWNLPLDYQWIILHKNERVESFAPKSKVQVMKTRLRMRYL